MPRRTPMYRWDMAVRGCLRGWIREHGMVPSLCAFASGGADYREVNMLPRLDLFAGAGRHALEEHVSAHVRRYGALFAGLGGTTVGGEFEGRDGAERELSARFALIVVSEGEVRKSIAPVGAEGLGAWSKSGFVLGRDIGWLVGMLEGACV